MPSSPELKKSNLETTGAGPKGPAMPEGVVNVTKETAESLSGIDVGAEQPSEQAKKKAASTWSGSSKSPWQKETFKMEDLDGWTPQALTQEIVKEISSRIVSLRKEERQLKSIFRKSDPYRLCQVMSQLRKLSSLLKDILKMTLDKLKALFVKLVVNKEEIEKIKS